MEWIEVSWQVKMANSTAVPTNEQLQAIRQILITKERPLSWEFFGQELEKCNFSFTCQSVQDALCQKAIPGVLSSRDFITLDTPRNVGLLKLQLAVAVNEKINGGRFSKANHYFHIIASDEEKDELGHNEDTLAKSFLEFDDVFHTMTSLAASVGSYKRVSVKQESALLHKSFFAFEKDKKTSAVHKVKYLLHLCHGLTDTWSAFEFSRCFLAKEEKVFFARNTIAEFVSALKSLKVSLYISDSAVALSSSLLQRKETLAPGNDGQRELLRIFDEEDIVLFKDILQNGPLSWNCFLSILESRKPGTYSITLREMLTHSSTDGLMPSPDFISLCDIRSTALIKLHFLVTVNNKLGNGQLGKISYHFNVIAAEKERDHIGRHSKMISKSLLKYDDIFHLPSDGGDRCKVKCGPLAIPFDSFFQMEGNREESFRHKLKYFLNLCGGTCTVFSAFEFSRNLLRSDEKQLFKCNQESFVSLVSSLDDLFKVISDKIQLCKSHSWFTPSEAASFTSGDDKHQASSGGDGKPTAAVVTKVNELIPKSLTVKFVTDILKRHSYPMSWKEFLKKFMHQETSDAVSTVETFLRHYYNRKGKKLLCMSEDFVALNAPYHRNRLKLALILENRSHCSNKPKKISMKELKEQFEEIASREEIMATGRNYDSFCKFIGKFPMIFSVQGDYVGQVYRCLRFPSFFAKEKEGALPSVIHKLNYFVNICHSDSDIRFTCKFLQRHLSLKEELQLVDSDEKVHWLAQEAQSGKTKSYPTGVTVGDAKRENDIGNNQGPKPKKMLNVFDEVDIALFKDILQEGPLSWKFFLSQLESRRTNTYSVALRDMFSQSQPDGLINSPDFISLNDVKSTGLAKLHFIVSVNSKSGDVSLNKISYHFSVFGSDEEREEFGRNSDGILQSLLKYKDVFLLPHDGGNKRSVKCGPRAIPFDSFFQLEGKSEESFNHKLKYFVNLCGGICTMSSAFEFSRNLLSKDEKQLFICNKESFFELVTSQKSFTLTADKIQLCKSHLWSTRSETATLLPVYPKIPNSGNNQGPKPKKMLNVFDEVDIALFKDILQEGPLSWKFFLSQLESRRTNTYSVALRDMFSQSQPDGLINSPDFISLNDVKSTGLAKLHFIVSVNSKSGDVSLNKISYHFSVFGSDEEREEFGRNSDGILQSLLKYKDVFLLPHDGGNKRSVKCGPRAIPFDSFFQLEGKSEESFNHKLKYFVNLCGGTCTVSSAFELSRNLLSKDEKQLFICNKESFFELVSSQKSFTLTADKIQLCKSHLWSTRSETATLLPVYPKIPNSDDWFSEELGDPAGIPVVLESACDQETYCLRKVDSSSICQVPQQEAESYDSNLSNLTNELISQYSQSNAENIIQLLTLLGNDIFTTLSSKLKDQSERTVEDLSEITLHVGRQASARFHQKTNGEQPIEVDASSQVTTRENLEEIEMKDALTGFDDYNRCGVEGCLHSIRRITNRKKKLIGLTVRVALPLLGCADMMYDIALSDKSTLILGRRGVGKTTLLRELARCLSDTEGNKVVVIDTYNEIAGDCDTPHFSIGRASRLQVDSPDHQHRLITESAKNHNPDVVIIDQIELPSDISAISHVRKQGIKVIAGVSRDSVSSLFHDETLPQMYKVGDSDFLDDMSSLDSAGALAKSKLRPVFEALVEMKETDSWHIHDLMYTLSNVSNGQAYTVQERIRIGLNHRQPGWEQEILLREKVINPHDPLH